MSTEPTNTNNDIEPKSDADDPLEYTRSSPTPDASATDDRTAGRGETARRTSRDAGPRATVERARRPTRVGVRFADPAGKGDGRWCS
ncbi:hypothetical protein [Haladaptatus salinisoli]|uniref:hypothetical protein n=1 Tax=Haladaptatus salinisoli TaxID=2884876 RepID=UPI001D09AB82|nr:hypothetical protein [Haladaptatus salinisoli]